MSTISDNEYAAYLARRIALRGGKVTARKKGRAGVKLSFTFPLRDDSEDSASESFRKGEVMKWGQKLSDDATNGGKLFASVDADVDDGAEMIRFAYNGAPAVAPDDYNAVMAEAEQPAAAPPADDDGMPTDGDIVNRIAGNTAVNGTR